MVSLQAPVNAFHLGQFAERNGAHVMVSGLVMFKSMASVPENVPLTPP